MENPWLGSSKFYSFGLPIGVLSWHVFCDFGTNYKYSFHQFAHVILIQS